MAKFPPIALLLIGAAASTPLAAQSYRAEPLPTERSGVPETLVAPPPPADPALAIQARFAAMYGSAGRPTVMIFWNREFTDDLETERESYVTVNTRGNVAEQANARTDYDRYGVSRSASRSASADGSTEMRAGAQVVNDGRRQAMLPQDADIQIQNALKRTLRDAGVVLGDRALMLRATSRRTGETANRQAVESDAILGTKGLLVEVGQLADSDDGDVLFAVSIKNVAANREIASFTTAARPPVGHRPYVAGSRGFERAPLPPVTDSARGRQLATEIMQALIRAM